MEKQKPTNVDMRSIRALFTEINEDAISDSGMITVTTNFPAKWLIFINHLLQEKDIAPSRSELFRQAVHDYLDKHYPRWLEEVMKIEIPPKKEKDRVKKKYGRMVYPIKKEN